MRTSAEPCHIHSVCPGNPREDELGAVDSRRLSPKHAILACPRLEPSHEQETEE